MPCETDVNPLLDAGALAICDCFRGLGNFANMDDEALDLLQPEAEGSTSGSFSISMPEASAAPARCCRDVAGWAQVEVTRTGTKPIVRTDWTDPSTPQPYENSEKSAAVAHSVVILFAFVLSLADSARHCSRQICSLH